MTNPNEALTALCEILLDEWRLGPEQIASIAKDIPGECEAMVQNRAESAWEDHCSRLMETGGPDDSAYRKAMKEAGRGHLLR